MIWPQGRSGRWMDPKPQPGTPPASPNTGTMERGREVVATAPTPASALQAVTETAIALGAHPDAVAELLEPLDGDPTALLRQRLSVLQGEGQPGASWALGHAWRGLYDALRARFEGTFTGFEPFADLAGRLERVAFGPPPVNAAKLLSLIDAGLVDDASLQHGLPGEPDVVVDAVLAPPGVVEGSFIAGLVADGLLHSPTGRRGVAVGPDASCLDPDGNPVPGLACIGRATEDVVIGNDTLNRSLHPAVDGWARRIAQKGTP